MKLAHFSSQAADTRGVSKDRLENLAPDRILLKNLCFFGRHGVLPEVSNIWAHDLLCFIDDVLPDSALFGTKPLACQ